MKNIKALFVASFLLSPFVLLAQSVDDLMNELDKEQVVYTSATFKGTQLALGQTVEAPSRGVLQSMFSHRFGTLEDPLYTFLGMNQASIRFGFDYGITNRFSVGLGRSSGLGGTTPPPTYDFHGKYRVLMQSTGARNMPVTVALFAGTAINTEHWPQDGIVRTTADRMSYTGQVLIARKFNERLSLQVMPTVLHRNLVDNADQANTLTAIGMGGRVKLSKRTALTFEYYLSSAKDRGAGFYNPISIGYDIDTGGHIFQIFVTNSFGLIESQFLGSTSNDFFAGPKGIRLGFNFSRVFTLVKS